MLRIKSSLLVASRPLLHGLASLYLPCHLRYILLLILCTSVSWNFHYIYRGSHSSQPQGFVHAIFPA